MNRENEIINVRIDEIIPNRFQPRLAFNENELKELSESIKTHGIIQPLVLRRIGDKFEIIAGERRYKASVMAGLTTVPAIIMNIDDKQSAEVAVVENLQRKDLTAIEEAQSYKKILDMGYLTQEELAARMGVAQPTVANKLRLLNLTEPVQQALLRNQISERHARSLLQIPDESIQVNMLKRIISERLTVRQTDEEIGKILGRAPITSAPISSPTTPNSPVTPTSPVGPTPVAPREPVAPVTPTVNTPTQPSPAPTSNIFTNAMNAGNTNAFDVNVDKIKTESQDIIKEHVPSDINMLLRKEGDEETGNTSPVAPTKKISLEDEVANVDMGSIVKPESLAINPFQEVEPEIMNFEMPAKQPTPEPVTPRNSLIDEFRQQQTYREPVNTPTAPESSSKSLASAINMARDESKKIESLGFNVDTEEFDFEDMYQIIIKIKK